MNMHETILSIYQTTALKKHSTHHCICLFWLFVLTGSVSLQAQSTDMAPPSSHSPVNDSLYHKRKKGKAPKEKKQPGQQPSQNKPSRNKPSRWQLAGNVSLQPKPFFINASPLAGYRFNEHWIAGLGPTYTYHKEGLFSAAAPSKGLPMHVYGGRVFLARRLYKPLFAQVETEALNYPYFTSAATPSPPAPAAGGERKARQWVVNPMAGLCYNLALGGKSFFQLTVLYNFNYYNDPFNRQLYNSPWIFRLGAGVGNGKK